MSRILYSIVFFSVCASFNANRCSAEIIQFLIVEEDHEDKEPSKATTFESDTSWSQQHSVDVFFTPTNSNVQTKPDSNRLGDEAGEMGVDLFTNADSIELALWRIERKSTKSTKRTNQFEIGSRLAAHKLSQTLRR
jgi:hypothetical protein